MFFVKSLWYFKNVSREIDNNWSRSLAISILPVVNKSSSEIMLENKPRETEREEGHSKRCKSVGREKFHEMFRSFTRRKGLASRDTIRMPRIAWTQIELKFKFKQKAKYLSRIFIKRLARVSWFYSRYSWTFIFLKTKRRHLVVDPSIRQDIPYFLSLLIHSLSKYKTDTSIKILPE